MSSSLCRSSYVSRCVDTAESQTPPAADLTSMEALCDQKQQSAAVDSTPLLLLSPAETDTGEVGATASHQHKQPRIKHRKAFKCSRHSKSNRLSQSGYSVDDGSDKGSKKNLRAPDADLPRKEEPSFLHPENENFHLPRSSLVISWHGRVNDASNPSSDPPSPASGSPSLARHECLKSNSEEDLESKPSSYQSSFLMQVAKKQNCTSSSSNRKCLLTSGLHLPYSGQEGLAEEHKRRNQSNHTTPHTAGCSTSTQQSKKRGCSDVPESSAEIFKTSCELEKENAHFIVVDMVLEMLESAKWTLSLDQWLSTMDTHRDTHCQMCRQRHTSSAQDSSPHKQAYKGHRPAGERSTDDPSNRRRHPDEDMKRSHRDTHSYLQDKEEEEAEKDKAQHQLKTLSILSTDSGFEDCGADHTVPQRDTLRNAEQLAQHLVLEFKQSWLPSNELQRGRQSLRSSLQELPGTGRVAVSSSSLKEEIRQRTRMRGSLNWAPPRYQIIFTVQPTHRRSEVVALQHFLCAGCGTEVERRYIKKLRYCDYLGRYFCDCCHSNSEAVIPGRVLSSWDFGRYPVSDFSKQLLDSVWHQPLFDLTCVGKTLYGKVKELDKFRELRDQLLAIKKLLTVCRLSGSVLAELEALPAHLWKQPNLFSMDDLQKLKKGQLAAQMKAMLHSAIAHVEICELCLAHGFICEFCREKDVIFPFQSDKCKRCPACKACFHKKCFVERKCPKCARIQSRKNRWDGSVKSNT